MVTARAEIPWLCVKSFSSCFLGYRAPGLLLRLELLHSLCSVCRTGDVPLRVQKSSSVLDELFCIHKSRKNRLLMRESMTLRHFGGQFACFSAKDIYKVWRGRGLYSGCLCGKVYSINLYTANMKFVLCFCCLPFLMR